MCSVSGMTRSTDPTELAIVSHQADVSDAGDGVRDQVKGDVIGTLVVECDSFCDFVRFEPTVTDQTLSARSRLADDNGGTAPLLRACIEKYKLLFEALVSSRILQDSQSVTSAFMDQFVTYSSDKSDPDRKNVSPSCVRCVDRVELAGLTKTVIEAFSLSCQMLVDFSALPIYSESAISSPTANSSGKNFSSKFS